MVEFLNPDTIKLCTYICTVVQLYEVASYSIKFKTKPPAFIQTANHRKIIRPQ